MSHAIVSAIAFIERGDDLLLAVKSADSNVSTKNPRWWVLDVSFENEHAAKGLLFQQKLSGGMDFGSTLARIRKFKPEDLDSDMGKALAQWEGRQQPGVRARIQTAAESIEDLQSCADSSHYSLGAMEKAQRAIDAIRGLSPMPNPNEAVDHKAVAARYPLGVSIGQSGLSDSAKAALIENPELAKEAGPMGVTPLHTLAMQYTFGDMVPGIVESGKLLIERGAEVNAVNILGQTPLLSAASEGSSAHAFVEDLIRAGADANARDRDGNSALHCATGDHRKEIFDILILAGADVNAANAKGETPLHKMASRYSFDEATAGILVDLGADIDARDQFGSTPLHCAAAQGRAANCAFLLSHGANPSLRDSKGKSALDQANKRGEADMVAMLEARLLEQAIPTDATKGRRVEMARGLSL